MIPATPRTRKSSEPSGSWALAWARLSPAVQGGIGLGLKRGGSVGRLSRHNSITGANEAGKPLARAPGGSLVIDLEAQAVASPPQNLLAW